MSEAGLWAPTPPGSPVFVTDGSRRKRLTLKPLIVGYTHAGRKIGPWGELVDRRMFHLAELLGTTPETFLCLFDRVNFLRHWRGSSFGAEDDKGGPFPRASTAMVIADGFRLRGAPLIFLDRKVSNAFELDVVTKCHWSSIREKPACVIPSPDGNLITEKPWPGAVAKILREALLYHGRTFRIGEYPYGYGADLQVTQGKIWGEAARRQKHKSPKPPVAGVK